MIIHPNTLIQQNGHIYVSARVELETPPHNLPETLWFRFPEAQAAFISDHADAFACALVSLALARGENIHVRGALSPRLAWGINEYQRIQSLRSPNRYHPFEICADEYAPSEFTGNAIACAFSGGVDSFYTLWTHLPQNEKFTGNAITHALFVQGFDIGLDDSANFQICRDAYRTMLREFGVTLLTASTNARKFIGTNSWAFVHPLSLIALAHALGRGLGRFYMPPGFSYTDGDTGIVWALQDTLLSNESIMVLNDGASVTKFERISTLAHVPATYNTLRVCYVKRNGLMNCCECGKCINTMTALATSGTLQHYTTFPKPLTAGRIRAAHVSFAALPMNLATLRAVLAQRHYDLALNTGIMLLQNSFHWGMHGLHHNLRKKPSSYDHSPANAKN